MCFVVDLAVGAYTARATGAMGWAGTATGACWLTGLFYAMPRIGIVNIRLPKRTRSSSSALEVDELGVDGGVLLQSNVFAGRRRKWF